MGVVLPGLISSSHLTWFTIRASRMGSETCRITSPLGEGEGVSSLVPYLDRSYHQLTTSSIYTMRPKYAKRQEIFPAAAKTVRKSLRRLG